MAQKSLNFEAKRRRTFAIISHPDAGKTTLTEKLLLYGGAVRQAGGVKSRKAKHHAVSDWMEMEKQRGISVTSSVLQFDYQNLKINILDTPGHQDFSEDTYRTLMAADSVVMLIDAAKGVEEQTKKLFRVCRNRGIPIFTFINKLDRYSRESLELLDEIEKVLDIKAYPMNWPVGRGKEFTGIYDRQSSTIELFTGGNHGQSIVPTRIGDLSDPAITAILKEHVHTQLKDDIELLDLAGDEYDINLISQGKLTPVYFGSALTNFGVRAFLDSFIELAPSPGEKITTEGVTVPPENEEFSGFVFKIQANMNPNHRDRIAFVRMCSGTFERGMMIKYVPTNKFIRLSQSKQFMAQETAIIDKAFPGDIIGVFDPGIFRIGDTLTENSDFEYKEIPCFQPEMFARVHLRNVMKRKQFIKGIKQLVEEGAIQKFQYLDIGIESPVIGAVGALQFEVFEYRLKNEYGADIYLEKLPYTVARWVAEKDLSPKSLVSSNNLVLKDNDGNYVVLFPSELLLNWEIRNNKYITFVENSILQKA
ncbi:MAG: peptide chain release factor 3 [Clostridiales bacterium]|nr:peptide chain release factor 3 [Clostridiales bacterium]MCF8023739.1 peptide chain release factor 3 [Clostridiales bacterium]